MAAHRLTIESGATSDSDCETNSSEDSPIIKSPQHVTTNKRGTRIPRVIQTDAPCTSNQRRPQPGDPGRRLFGAVRPSGRSSQAPRQSLDQFSLSCSLAHRLEVRVRDVERFCDYGFRV